MGLKIGELTELVNKKVKVNYLFMTVCRIDWHMSKGLEDRSNKQDDHNCWRNKTPSNNPIATD